MCGRFGLNIPTPHLAEHFMLATVPQGLTQRWNVAPTQAVAAVRLSNATGLRELIFPRWGLVPVWAEDPRIGSKLINARAETATEKPAFQSAMRHRRCLIPASGFFEWQRLPDGTRQPYWIRLRGGGLLGLAGLFETRQDPTGGPDLLTCTILTVPANALVAELHERMPAIVQPGSYAEWLAPETQPPVHLLAPFAAQAMEQWPVSPRVNSPGNDGPDLLRPMPVQGGLPL